MICEVLIVVVHMFSVVFIVTFVNLFFLFVSSVLITHYNNCSIVA